MMDTYFARMPFSCFKYQGFSASKRYSTVAAKHSTAFFDSSYNHIRQNSQLQTVEKVAAQGAKRLGNPHPANAGSVHYLQVDTDENNNNSFNNESNVNASANATGNFVLKGPVNVGLDKGGKKHNGRLKQTNLNRSLQSQIQMAPVTNMLVSRLQSKRLLYTDHETRAVAAEMKPSDEVAAQEPTPEPSVHSDAKYFSPGEIEYVELTDDTFVQHHTQEIQRAYRMCDYNRINALYNAMKRNGLVPSRDVYDMVLSSIAMRDIDHSVDDQMSMMLNVYSDLISNKIKPDLHIYSTVIYQLLDKSIKCYIDKDLSNNGCDFFKIAIDIFNASNCSHIQQFDGDITDMILVGMNLYPGLVNNTQLIKILEKQPNFVKNDIYYSAMINCCKFTNDSELAIQLYEEFKQKSLEIPSLKENQFVIYSAFISTLVATNEIALATKFLDKLLTSIKNYEDYETKITMLLSSYLLHLSKTNLEKSLEIWAQFNRIDWIPEFSYEFYTNLLQDSLNSTSYDISVKLYNYMSALPRSTVGKDLSLDTMLTTPRRVENAISQFMLTALQHNDKATVLKVLRESFIRKTTFDHQVYAPLFHFIQSDELIIKIINSHGLQIKDGFKFLNYLTCHVPNLPLYGISGTEFFKRLVDEFSLEEPNDFSGFFQVWKSVFDDVHTTPSNELLEICAPLIVEFYDLKNYYAELLSKDVLDFKMTLTAYFIDHYKPVEGASNVMQQATALLQDMKLMN